MNVIFFGSSDFSLPVLNALMSSEHKVLHVITTPDQKKGRGQKIAPSIVKNLALERGIPVSTPEKISVPQVIELVKSLQPDFLVVASYGKMIPSSIFKVPKFAALNVHPSLLPRHRGASPIQTAILEGDKQTGVSIAEVIKELDAGDIFGQVKSEIGDNENALELSDRLAQMAGTILLKVIDQFEKGKIARLEQDPKQMSYAKKLERDSGQISWNAPALRIHNQIRAFYPWPSAFTFFRGKRLKVLASRVSSSSAASASPGAIVHMDPRGAVHIQTIQGTLEILRVQLEGRKEMAAFEFALGQRIKTGDQLGTET